MSRIIISSLRKFLWQKHFLISPPWFNQSWIGLRSIYTSAFGNIFLIPSPWFHQSWIGLRSIYTSAFGNIFLIPSPWFHQSWIGLRSIYTSAFDYTGNTKDQEQDQDQQRSVFILGRYFDWGDGSWQWFSVGTRVWYKVKLRYSHSLI